MIDGPESKLYRKNAYENPFCQCGSTGEAANLFWWYGFEKKMITGTQSRLRSWQRQLPAAFCNRWNPASTINNKPPDGLTTSTGYALKRKSWVTSKTFLGCACIFWKNCNGILERHRLSRVIKNGPASSFLYHNISISSAKWFEPIGESSKATRIVQMFTNRIKYLLLRQFLIILFPW